MAQQMAGFEDARLVGPEQDSVSLQLVPADVSRASDAPTLSPSPARPARCPVAPSGWAQAYGESWRWAPRAQTPVPRRAVGSAGWWLGCWEPLGEAASGCDRLS